MSELDPLALLDQWNLILEDHQSMAEDPRRQRQMLDDLATTMLSTEVVGRRFYKDLLRRSATAHDWAVEWSLAQAQASAARISNLDLGSTTISPRQGSKSG